MYKFETYVDTEGQVCIHILKVGALELQEACFGVHISGYPGLHIF